VTTNSDTVLVLTISSWSGFAVAPEVVTVGSAKEMPPEPQADTKPALRLLKGGRD
jgi:hypothetical protein